MIINFASGVAIDDGDASTGGEVTIGDSAGVASGADAIASGEALWRAVIAAQLVETKSSPAIRVAGTGPAHILS